MTKFSRRSAWGKGSNIQKISYQRQIESRDTQLQKEGKRVSKGHQGTAKEQTQEMQVMENRVTRRWSITEVQR